LVNWRTGAVKLSSRNMSSELGGREVKVGVPWGEIAAREWGPVEGMPWIALHGWSDNAGTFDNLIPLFPPGHRLLCIDLPGHGLSSHLPPGSNYLLLDSVGCVERVAKHQGWTSFGLLGHSMGAGIASLYAATFPEKVKALIMLDMLKPISRGSEELVDRTKGAILGKLKNEDDNRPEKIYPSFEAAMERLMAASKANHGEDNINEDSARTMLVRGAKQVPGGWAFTRDKRLQLYSLYGLHPEHLKEFASNIKCPHLLLKALEVPMWDSEELNQSILEIYSRNPRYQFQSVVGAHHVHLTQPHIVAPHIKDFLQRNQLQVEDHSQTALL